MIRRRLLPRVRSVHTRRPGITTAVHQLFKTQPKGRCAGHSAIPVQQSEAPYAQKFPVPLKSPDLKLGLNNGWYNRGFQLLELAGAGKPGRISYFEVADADSIPSPIFVEQVESRAWGWVERLLEMTETT